MHIHLLWNMNGSNLSSSEHLLLTGHQLFEKVYRHIVVWWQVDTDVCRKKIVNFSLAAVLAGKFLRGNVSFLNLLIGMLFHIFDF